MVDEESPVSDRVGQLLKDDYGIDTTMTKETKKQESKQTMLNNMSAVEVLKYVDRSNPEVKRLAELLENIDGTYEINLYKVF